MRETIWQLYFTSLILCFLIHVSATFLIAMCSIPLYICTTFSVMGLSHRHTWPWCSNISLWFWEVKHQVVELTQMASVLSLVAVLTYILLLELVRNNSIFFRLNAFFPTFAWSTAICISNSRAPRIMCLTSFSYDDYANLMDNLIFAR